MTTLWIIIAILITLTCLGALTLGIRTGARHGLTGLNTWPTNHPQ